jgi:hypothetical protein
MEQTIVLPISWMSPDRAGHRLAERLAAALLLVELGLQNSHGGLHGLGALHQLGQEELTLAEEVADLLDALDEALVEDVGRRQTGREALARQLFGKLQLAVDHGLRHLGVEILNQLCPPSTHYIRKRDLRTCALSQRRQ